MLAQVLDVFAIKPRPTPPDVEALLPSTGEHVLVTAQERITHEARLLLTDPDARRAMTCANNPYGDGLASTRIVEILTSYQS